MISTSDDEFVTPPEKRAAVRRWNVENRDRKRENDRRYRETHKEKKRENNRAWTAKNREHIRNKHLRKLYGITLADYDRMLARQGGGCACCGTSDPGPKPFHVDHDHGCCPGRESCGNCVRWLLCANCNLGVGHFKNDPAILRRMADLLEAHS